MSSVNKELLHISKKMNIPIILQKNEKGYEQVIYLNAKINKHMKKFNFTSNF